MGLSQVGKRWGFGKWTIAVLSAIYAAVFIYVLISRPWSKDFYHGFFNVYQFAPPLFGAICGFVLAFKGKHLSKSMRAGWICVALGCLSFAIGQGTWTYLETIKGQEVPFPGWPDAGYVGTYPFLIAAMVLLMQSGQVAGRARLLLDSAIAAGALGVLSWYFIMGRLWAKTDVSMLGKIISVAYPLGDVAVIFMAIVAFNSMVGDRARRRSMALLGIGMILIAFADTTFTLMSLNETYETGSWSDWGWSFGWLLVAFGCLNRFWNVPAAETGKAKATKNWAIFLRAFGPYLAVLASLGVTFGVDYFDDHKISLSSHTEVFFLGALIVIRQLFMLVENVGLTKRITAINDELEHRVEERTRQLSHMQDLTRAVNTTLDVNLVLAEGANHIAGLMNADAVAVWLPKNPSDKKSALSLRHRFGFDRHAQFLEELCDKTHFVGDAALSMTEILPDGTKAQYVIAKLQWQDTFVGTIAIVRWSNPFDSNEVGLAEGAAVELGSALHNAIQHAVALEQADKDAVTGLLNHRAFHQRFHNALKLAEKNATDISVMMLDLNNFKLFNDTYGHMAGDQVLKTVAKALADTCPKTSIIARYGGDEFILALPGLDGDRSEEVAHALSAKLADLGFTKSDDDRKIPITLSAGIASYPVDAKMHHDLLALADTNLYTAKSTEEGVTRINEQQRQNRALRGEGSFEVLDALVTAVDNKDRYTRKHSEDVTEYALWIAEDLGLSQETMRVVRIAGLLHDVGKIGVPSDVLKKPGRLTPEEFEIIKRHPRLGELIVSAIPGMEPIVDGVRCHHERWDGQGYPDQLAGEDIPFLGRLLAVADAFSAMTTDRPYRKGMSWEVALEQIEQNKGTQFDPHLAEVFMKVANQRNPERKDNIELDAA